MQRFVLASSNQGKVKEIRHMLKDLSIELISQTQLNIEDAIESGTTFVENAIIKARHAAKLSGLPAIADDSGLSIQALNGEPGVHSSRYAGEYATDEDRINKALKELERVDDRERLACFYCAIVLFKNADDPAPLIAQGEWKGQILYEPRGDKGFGYDPIFYVPTHDMSAAELDPIEKNQISHRARAMKEFKRLLPKYLNWE